MEGLYKKVTRGYYSRINKIYSDDLSNLLKNLIKVNPNERMTCRKISLIQNKFLNYHP